MNSTDRFQRQSLLVPRSATEPIAATVIGVGAIGRQVALQLASLGVPQLTLVDFDCVEPTNITTQGYWRSDLGLPKVTATWRAIKSERCREWPRPARDHRQRRLAEDRAHTQALGPPAGAAPASFLLAISGLILSPVQSLGQRAAVSCQVQEEPLNRC